jgi:hypothetical protein
MNPWLTTWHFQLAACLVFSVVFNGNFANANALEQFERDGHIKIAVSVHPESGVVPGQKAQLIIEIATDTWFTGGTRISPPEVPGLVILQNEQFASNATEVRNGTTWVTQRWTIDVFPQREGEHTIQPARLRIKTRSDDGKDIEGDLFTPLTKLNAVIPSALIGIEHWVAAPEFVVDQSLDGNPEALQVGDALTRTVTIDATDVMPMMLPEVTSIKPSGMSVYPAPPVLNSSNNRGSQIATRIQTTSYMAEQAGKYSIPAQEFFWWDTTAGKLKIISLPEIKLNVSGDAVKSASGKSVSAKAIGYGAGALIVISVLLFWAYKLLRSMPWGKARAALERLLLWVKALRKPALPVHLNPGSNAGD